MLASIGRRARPWETRGVLLFASTLIFLLLCSSSAECVSFRVKSPPGDLFDSGLGRSSGEDDCSGDRPLSIAVSSTVAAAAAAAAVTAFRFLELLFWLGEGGKDWQEELTSSIHTVIVEFCSIFPSVSQASVWLLAELRCDNDVDRRILVCVLSTEDS
jgi:hypothetical protein